MSAATLNHTKSIASEKIAELIETAMCPVLEQLGQET
jgi:hypothetical protein